MLKPATSSQTYKIKLQVFRKTCRGAQKISAAASNEPAPGQLADAAGAKAASGSLRGRCGLLSTGRRISDVGVLGFLVYFPPTQSRA